MNKFYFMPHPPVMVKEVGKGQEIKIQNTINACEYIGKEIKNLDVDTIIIISPHGIVFSDGIGVVTSEKLKGDLAKFGGSEVSMEFEINKKLTNEIIKKADENGILVASLDENTYQNYGVKLQLDHGAIVPLYFIPNNKKYKLVHITYGMLSKFDLYKFGVLISESVKKLNEKAVFIASGDLSHRLKEEGPYSFSMYGKEFDNTFLKILQLGDMERLFSINSTLINEAGECGLRSSYILAGAMDGLDIKGEILSYEGTFGVGYGVVKFNVKESKESLLKKLEENKINQVFKKLNSGDEYTQLARKSLYYYYKNGKYLTDLTDLSQDMLNERRGAFVSLKKENQLRGCIGTIVCVSENIATEIVKNAISAAIEDPRFPPVKENELGEIDISVDILYEAEKCTINDLDVYEYGVIVSTNTKRGLLLPNLEGVNTVEEQLGIALQKAGIEKNENYNIERFKVERHKENELDD